MENNDGMTTFEADADGRPTERWLLENTDLRGDLAKRFRAFLGNTMVVPPRDERTVKLMAMAFLCGSTHGFGEGVFEMWSRQKGVMEEVRRDPLAVLAQDSMTAMAASQNPLQDEIDAYFNWHMSLLLKMDLKVPDRRPLTP